MYCFLARTLSPILARVEGLQLVAALVTLKCSEASVGERYGVDSAQGRVQLFCWLELCLLISCLWLCGEVFRCQKIWEFLNRIALKCTFTSCLLLRKRAAESYFLSR